MDPTPQKKETGTHALTYTVTLTVVLKLFTRKNFNNRKISEIFQRANNSIFFIFFNPCSEACNNSKKKCFEKKLKVTFFLLFSKDRYKILQGVL